MPQNFQSNKSIDVDGVFYMDLAPNESASDDELSANEELKHTRTSSLDSKKKPSGMHRSEQTGQPGKSVDNGSFDHLSQTSYATSDCNIVEIPEEHQYDCLSSSLDRLARVINEDDEPNTNKPYVFTAKLENPHESDAFKQLERSICNECCKPSSSCSLSEDSFVASSGTSSSNSFIEGTVSESEDRRSNTTREDSGVLDMKDLAMQFNNSYDVHDDSLTFSRKDHERLVDGKPISQDRDAKNLIKRETGNYSDQRQTSQNQNMKQYRRRPGQPTVDGRSNIHGHHNYHNHHSNNHFSSGRRRPVSASAPIQVPSRQMKRGLNKMKLDLMREEAQLVQEEMSPPVAGNNEFTQSDHSDSRKDRDERQIDYIFDDDAFLDQEYNGNHHNRYQNDNIDDEHPGAERDPMKLFESIQAMARSLHGDAELFGSLPPKRILESPIRSIALV